MSASLVKDIAFDPNYHGIDKCLFELERYGRPMLSKMDSGWYCKVDVFVTGKGTEFKVRSDFGCKFPKLAVNQCYNRLVESIKKLNDSGKLQ